MRRTLIAFILTLALVSTAFAQSFSDVPFGSWFYVDVESLVTQGIVDGSMEQYRPGDNVNRAEMSKLIVEAFEIPLQNPEFETFLDVPGDAWYSPYVETVAMNGIAIGYLDQNGDLNNLFGPNDPITREQAAKMIVLGAELSLNTGCGQVFNDVSPQRWSYEYIGTLYANSIIEGYDDGSFRPGNNINRAEIARILNQSLNPKLRDCADQGTVSESQAVGLLCEAHSTENAGNIPKGSSSIEFLTIQCTANGETVDLESLTFHRTGAGNDEDIENLYLYEGDFRLTNGKSINTETQTVEFTNLNYTLEPDQTVILTLTGDISADAATASQHSLEVSGAEDIGSTATSIQGSFPLTGTTYTLSGN